MDRRRAGRTDRPPARPDGRFYRDWLCIADLEVPTVAAVSGAAVGAGLALALACDLRFVAEDARLSVPFTRLGMHPGMLTTWSLPRVAGVAVARDLLLTGRGVDGVEAVRLGIASRALPSGEVLAVALERPGASPRTPLIATRLTKLALAGEGHADRDVGAPLGGAGPSRDPRLGGPPGGAGRPAGAASAPIRRALTPPRPQRTAKTPEPKRRAFPCAHPRPGVWCLTLGPPPGPVNGTPPPAVDAPVHGVGRTRRATPGDGPGTTCGAPGPPGHRNRTDLRLHASPPCGRKDSSPRAGTLVAWDCGPARAAAGRGRGRPA